VGIGGQQEAGLRVQLDPQALAAAIQPRGRANGAWPGECRLAERHAQQPASDIHAQHQRSAAEADDYANLVIAYRNGAPVRIRDVGRAVSAPENDLIAGWYNQKRAVLLAIQRQPAPTSSTR